MNSTSLPQMLRNLLANKATLVIVVLVAIAAITFGASFAAAPSATSTGGAAPVSALFSATPLPGGTGPTNTLAPAPSSLNGPGLYLELIGKLGIVIAAIGAVALLGKKFLPKSLTASSKGAILVTDRVPVGQSSALLLVSVKGSEFLIGVTRENITALADLSGGPSGKDDSAFIERIQAASKKSPSQLLEALARDGKSA